MYAVGITGGIGSGKSLICKIFELLNLPVYYADHEAKRIIENSLTIRDQLLSRFGERIFQSGRIDRKKLAALVFNDKNALNYINSLVHPEVRNDFHKWAACRTNFPYVIEEAAILFESGVSDELNYIIAVSAPEEIRIQRVMQRDHVSRDDVLQRMIHQLKEEERNSRADAVIYNDDSMLVIPQVLKIHKEILLSAKA